MILETLILRQREWSLDTFGPGLKTREITSHIRKELDEIESSPESLEEWADVILLALDGAWRTGASSAQIARALSDKISVNKARQWPDKDTLISGEPIEHIRSVTP